MGPGSLAFFTLPGEADAARSGSRCEQHGLGRRICGCWVGKAWINKTRPLALHLKDAISFTLWKFYNMCHLESLGRTGGLRFRQAWSFRRLRGDPADVTDSLDLCFSKWAESKLLLSGTSRSPRWRSRRRLLVLIDLTLANPLKVPEHGASKASWSAAQHRQTWLLVSLQESHTCQDGTPRPHCWPHALDQSLEKRPAPQGPSIAPTCILSFRTYSFGTVGPF